MGRARRIHVPDCVVLVTQVCHDRKMLLRDRSDKATYLRQLQERLDRFDYTLISYCLGDGDVRLLLRTPQTSAGHTLSAFMHSLNTAFGRRYNRRHGRQGTLWTARYGVRWVPGCSPENLLKLIWQVEGGPARRGRPSPVEGWAWCSAYWMLRGEGSPVPTSLRLTMIVLLNLLRPGLDPVAFLQQVLKMEGSEFDVESSRIGQLWLDGGRRRAVIERERAILPRVPVTPSWPRLVEVYSALLLPVLPVSPRW